MDTIEGPRAPAVKLTVFGLWRICFPPVLVRTGRRLPVQALGERGVLVTLTGYPCQCVCEHFQFVPRTLSAYHKMKIGSNLKKQKFKRREIKAAGGWSRSNVLGVRLSGGPSAARGSSRRAARRWTGAALSWSARARAAQLLWPIPVCEGRLGVGACSVAAAHQARH